MIKTLTAGAKRATIRRCLHFIPLRLHMTRASDEDEPFVSESIFIRRKL